MMGMYACDRCFKEYKLREAKYSGTNHAICELCGYLKDNWDTQSVAFTTDVDRPFMAPDNREFILNQLTEIGRMRPNE